MKKVHKLNNPSVNVLKTHEIQSFLRQSLSHTKQTNKLNFGYNRYASTTHSVSGVSALMTPKLSAETSEKTQKKPQSQSCHFWPHLTGCNASRDSKPPFSQQIKNKCTQKREINYSQAQTRNFLQILLFPPHSKSGGTWLVVTLVSAIFSIELVRNNTQMILKISPCVYFQFSFPVSAYTYK